MVKKYVRETIVFDEKDIKEVAEILDKMYKFRMKLAEVMNVKYPPENDEIIYLLDDINDHNVDAIKDFFDTYGYDVDMPFFY